MPGCKTSHHRYICYLSITSKSYPVRFHSVRHPAVLLKKQKTKEKLNMNKVAEA